MASFDLKKLGQLAQQCRVPGPWLFVNHNGSDDEPLMFDDFSVKDAHGMVICSEPQSRPLDVSQICCGPYIAAASPDVITFLLDERKRLIAGILDGETPWLDIRGAPLDGTEILLKRGARVTSGRWLVEREVMDTEYHSSGSYMGQLPTGEIAEAHWMTVDGGFSADEPPTHWMPLPKP